MEFHPVFQQAKSQVFRKKYLFSQNWSQVETFDHDYLTKNKIKIDFKTVGKPCLITIF